MSHEKSEEMMRLLQELTVLKEMDGDTSSSNDGTLSHEQVLREHRRKEISEEMRQLAAETKAEASKPKSK